MGLFIVQNKILFKSRMYLTARYSEKILCKHYQKPLQSWVVFKETVGKYQKSYMGWVGKISSMTDHGHIIRKSEIHGLWM